MQARYRELSGFEADDASDIGIRLKVLAEQVALLYGEAERLRGQVFPQSSTGEFLELHAQARGIARKPAVAATGMIRFRREIAPANDIPITEGVICATRQTPQLRFETTEAGVLPAGSLMVDISAICMTAGSIGNVAAGSVCVPVAGATGISHVENIGPFSGGVDGEGDDELRGRLLESYKNISNGTNRAFYYDLAMSFDGVDSVNVIPRRRGRGTVDVVVAASSGPAGIIDALVLEFAEKKEVNVDVAVLSAVVVHRDFGLEDAPGADYNYQAVEEKALLAAAAYVSGLKVGEPLLLARLGSAVLAAEGVDNYKITGLSGDVTPAVTEVIRPGSITITRMATG